jgi:hypothetical protein
MWDEVETSCTGKVLVIGGYTVLERPNVGLVFPLPLRFYSQIKVDPMSGEEMELSIRGGVLIQIHSHQYDTSYYYELLLDTVKTEKGKPTFQLESLTITHRHVFAEKCLDYSLNALPHLLTSDDFKDLMDGLRVLHANKCKIMVSLRGDNEFYSPQREVRMSIFLYIVHVYTL